MKRIFRRGGVGLVAVLIAGSVASTPTLALARHHKHGHRSIGAQGSGAGVETGNLPAHRDPRGIFAGAGGVFSPDYELPGGEVYHLGGQLLGGDFGKAYEDYYRHYYYYKYAYCPIGSSYVIYLRRCVSPFDLFK